MKPLQSVTEQPTVSFAQKVINVLQVSGEFAPEIESRFKKLQINGRGRTLCDLLADAGVDESKAQQTIAHISGFAFHQLEDGDIAVEIVERIGLAWCCEHRVIPLKCDGRFFVAAGTVEDLFHVDDLMFVIGEQVDQVLVTTRSLRIALEYLTKQCDEEHEGESTFVVEDCIDSSLDLEPVTADADSSPVVSTVSSMIEAAVRENASDIHFEPRVDESVMRYRIDGILHDLMHVEQSLHNAIVSRIKILANLDIAERRIPQDGRIRATVLGRSIDLRVSSVPTPKGEKVVLRLLDDKNIRIGLNDLGFQRETLKRWKTEISNPHGIILVTGPTGCGKTTTLYSSLQEMDRERLNISTVEDPVEYELDGITQIQVHEQIDMTFAKALRALLRQDPDVVLLGEIRDFETASTAIQAAMTGHLVLSTLHTNDAPSSMTRLINIGIEPFLVASAVNAVLAQRLARKVCSKCVEMKKPTAQEKELLQGYSCKEIPNAVGCSSCRDSGYAGRIGLYELLIIDDELRDAIAGNPSITAFRNLAVERGMVNLQADGFAKVAQGLTTIDEIYRLTH